MKINIERFGLTDVQIGPDTVFTFTDGMPGFEACKRFKLFHEEGKATVFWLQSLDDTAVTFSLMDPSLLDFAYQIELSDADVALLGLEAAEDAAVELMVYRNEAEGGTMGANTLAPIILNVKTRLGMQKVLQEVHQTMLYRGR